MEIEMKILILSDIHHQDKEYFIQYQLNKLDEIKTIIRQKQIDTIVVTGDVNHKHKISDNRVLEIFRNKHLELRKLVKNFYVITGNHDIYFKNTNKFNSLRSFFPETQYTIVDNQPLKIENCLLIPWICTENKDIVVKKVKEMNKKDNYLFGHLELSNFDIGFVKSEKDHLYRQDYEKYRKIFTGHFHTPQQQRNIEYVGSLHQLKKNDTKYRHIVIIDTETHEIERIKNTDTIFENVFIENNLDEETITNKIGDITNKIVEITIDSSDTKYLNKVENIIINKQPHDFNIICNDINDEIDVDIQNIGNINDINQEYLDSLEFETKDQEEEFKKLFSEYLNNALIQ